MARFYTVEEVVDMISLGSRDVVRHNRMRLLKWAKYVWQDMNLDVIKDVKREIFELDGINNEIKMPKGFLALSSASAVGHHGEFWPLYRSDMKMHKDIPDITAAQNCSCPNNCGGSLCNMIKGYVAVQSTQSDLMPNGSPVSFNCVNRMTSDDQGFVYQSIQYPKRIYTNGVWTNTVLYTENKTLCQCQVNSNGCITDCQENWDLVCGSTVAQMPPTNFTPTLANPFPTYNPNNISPVPNPPIPFGGNANTYYNSSTNKWVYYQTSAPDWFGVQCGIFDRNQNFQNIYNVNELGDSVIFPRIFPFKKVMLRWYEDISLQDMKIPFLAVSAFADGLQWWDVRFDESRQKLEPKYSMSYSRKKMGYLGEINRYTLSTLDMMSTPDVHIPSTILDNRDWHRGRH